MKKFAFLFLVLIFQLNYGQKFKDFDSKITHAKAPTTEGCLEAYFGQVPADVFTPACLGREEEITASVMYSSYSYVNVTEGVEYLFITYLQNTNLTTTFITISDEAGTTVYASGYDTVKWTPTKNETVRFYVHGDNQCGRTNGFVKKYIRCGDVPPEPTYGCDQSYDGPFFAGLSVSSEVDYWTADDFFVPKDADAFKLKSLKYLLLPMAEAEDFASFTVEIRKDNNNSPGEVIASYENLIATETTQHTEDFIDYYPTFWSTLTIPNGGLEIPVNKDENTRYWVALQVTSKTGQNIFLTVFHRNGWLTAPSFQKLDGSWMTTTYQEDPGLEGIWSFDSDCSLLGVNDTETEKISIYPNPVKDFLYISTKKQIKDISILSISGQKLLSFAQPKNQQVNVSSLSPGTYLVNVKLENGNMQAFKMIKK
ncbi:MAG: T9SS type A sorting domain-containing protein [Flavobacteriia bacterium]|nr:T9SS type A sorting domain-containing protein [Flavobacteriia bacterium]MBH2024184.1 T9SS type A sorting domain-containing protein [Flavobacteriales bacterium]